MSYWHRHTTESSTASPSHALQINVPLYPYNDHHQRLTDEGRRLLQDALASLRGRQPTLEEKRALLSRIQRLPGCQSYKLFYLHGWFALNTEGSVAPSRSAHKRHMETFNEFPTLTTSTRSQLSQLIAIERIANPHTFPPLAKVRLWAEMLAASGADPGEVERWVENHWVLVRWAEQDKRAREWSGIGSRNCDTHGHGREGTTVKGQLPTPPGTATREPQPWISTTRAATQTAAPPSSTEVPSMLYTHPAEDLHCGSGQKSAAPRRDRPRSRWGPALLLRNNPPTKPLSSLFPEILPLSPVSPQNVSVQKMDCTKRRTRDTAPTNARTDMIPNLMSDATVPPLSSTDEFMFPTVGRFISTQQPSFPIPLNVLIARGIADFERDLPNLNVEPLPTTAAAFNALFAQHEPVLAKLDRALEI